MIQENLNCSFIQACNHTDCDSFCIKRFKTEFFFEQGLIPLDKRLKYPMYVDKDGRDDVSFERLSNIEKNIVDYVQKGNNLYMYSKNPGNGKTSWAFRLLRSYINNT